ncbi:hypothetical protein N0V82_005344 [Gnomoniopsis sp. IMI 355080]|nr:hypothetical protein N0V82_005344 [Gnomoniopsis sp. IMI 355080]
MSRIIFSRISLKLWVTAGASVTIFVLLVAFKWQTYHYKLSYCKPLGPHESTLGFDQQPESMHDAVPISSWDAESPASPRPPFVPGNLTKVNHAQSIEDASNGTLGVAELIVISFPDRTDKRDRMTLMGAVTRLHFTFLPGVQEAKVPGSSMPSYAEGWTGKVRGSWRGHMDALWYVVYHILPSAIIFEDDLDWDVRIRSQASDFNVCPGLAGAAAAVERPTRRICKPYLPDG